MRYVVFAKDMDDQVASRRRYELYGHKDICGNCRFFGSTEGAEWGICHSMAFNRSVEVTVEIGRKSLEDLGGTFVRFGFSCPFFKRKGDTEGGGDSPPFGRGGPG